VINIGDVTNGVTYDVIGGIWMVNEWETREGPVSMDPTIIQLLDKARKDGMETGWDRVKQQYPHCKFGSSGVCCRRCFHGPCKIYGKVKRGICGADEDTIVLTNLIQLQTSGAVQHVEHSRELVETLEKIAKGTVPYEIKDEAKLRSIAEKLGVDSSGDIKEVAARVAEKAIENFTAQEGTLNWLEITANEKEKKKWKELGILPKNAHAEIALSLLRTSNQCDADPANLLQEVGRLGLVDGFAGLHLSTDLTDIMFGTPKLVKTESRLGVIKEDAVNIAVHGHLPILSEKIVEWAEKMEDEAKKVGASRINVVGICCTGNEVMMRHGIPLATNFVGQEVAMATGALDAMVVDVQCIMPNLQPASECYHTKIITTLPYIKLPGAMHVDFTPENADESAKKIIEIAIEAYKHRDKNKILIPESTMEMYGGFSVEQIVDALSKLNPEDPLQPVIDNIVSGNILGAVALVGCATFKYKQDYGYTELAKRLLKENVLVLATGCGGHSLARHGFMIPDGEGAKYLGDGIKAVLKAIGEANGLPSLPPVMHMGACVDNSRVANLLYALAAKLDVPVSKLPAVGSCPEMQSPKVLSIGSYFLALGVDVHVGTPFPISGSKLVTDILTGDKEDHPLTIDGLFGGKIIYEPDPKVAAEKIIERIKMKREALGI
jgi:carbon-monoxide dehydrogenase catalytic subunit